MASLREDTQAFLEPETEAPVDHKDGGALVPLAGPQTADERGAAMCTVGAAEEDQNQAIEAVAVVADTKPCNPSTPASSIEPSAQELPLEQTSSTPTANKERTGHVTVISHTFMIVDGDIYVPRKVYEQAKVRVGRGDRLTLETEHHVSGRNKFRATRILAHHPSAPASVRAKPLQLPPVAPAEATEVLLPLVKPPKTEVPPPVEMTGASPVAAAIPATDTLLLEYTTATKENDPEKFAAFTLYEWLRSHPLLLGYQHAAGMGEFLLEHPHVKPIIKLPDNTRSTSKFIKLHPKLFIWEPKTQRIRIQPNIYASIGSDVGGNTLLAALTAPFECLTPPATSTSRAKPKSKKKKNLQSADPSPFLAGARPTAAAGRNSTVSTGPGRTIKNIAGWTNQPTLPHEAVEALRNLDSHEVSVHAWPNQLLEERPTLRGQLFSLSIQKNTASVLLRERQKGAAYHNIEDLYAKFKSNPEYRATLLAESTPLQQLARNLNVTTTDLVIALVGSQKVREIVDEIAEAREDQLSSGHETARVLEAIECIDKDYFTSYKLKSRNYSMQTGNMLQAGTKGESDLQRDLRQNNIAFKTQEECVAREYAEQAPGERATPDALLTTPVWIMDKEVRWIEAKNCVMLPGITPPSILEDLEKQVAKYVERFGPGAILWTKCGFSPDIQIALEESLPVSLRSCISHFALKRLAIIPSQKGGAKSNSRDMRLSNGNSRPSLSGVPGCNFLRPRPPHSLHLYNEFAYPSVAANSPFNAGVTRHFHDLLWHVSSEPQEVFFDEEGVHVHTLYGPPPSAPRRYICRSAGHTLSAPANPHMAEAGVFVLTEKTDTLWSHGGDLSKDDQSGTMITIRVSLLGQHEMFELYGQSSLGELVSQIKAMMVRKSLGMTMARFRLLQRSKTGGMQVLQPADLATTLHELGIEHRSSVVVEKV